MAISDPSLALNPLLGTPMGPLNGVVPPNPLIANAMAQPIPPPMPANGAGGAGGSSMPTSENLEKAMKANKGMSDLLAQLLGANEVAAKDVLDILGTAVGNGYLTAQQAAGEITKMPQEPQAMRQWLQTHFIKNMQTGRRLNELSVQLKAQQPAPAKAV